MPVRMSSSRAKSTRRLMNNRKKTEGTYFSCTYTHRNDFSLLEKMFEAKTNCSYSHGSIFTIYDKTAHLSIIFDLTFNFCHR